MMNYYALRIFHMSRFEFYRMNPGIFYDLIQIHIDANKRGA